MPAFRYAGRQTKKLAAETLGRPDLPTNRGRVFHSRLWLTDSYDGFVAILGWVLIGVGLLLGWGAWQVLMS